MKLCKQSHQLCYRGPQRKNCGWKVWSFLQQLEVCSGRANNTLLGPSKVECSKDDMTKLKYNPYRTDVIQSCIRVKMNKNWRFYKIKNPTVFAAFLLTGVLLGCQDANFFRTAAKKFIVSCLTYEQKTKQWYNDNLCLFRAPALALHLHICTESTTGRRNFNFFQSFHKQRGLIQSQSVDGSPHERYSSCWGSTNTQYSALRHRYCRRKCYRRTCSTNVQIYIAI